MSHRRAKRVRQELFPVPDLDSGRISRGYALRQSTKYEVSPSRQQIVLADCPRKFLKKAIRSMK